MNRIERAAENSQFQFRVQSSGFRVAKTESISNPEL